MKTYQVEWKGTVYGRSNVIAESRKEALEKIELEEDVDFEWDRDYDPDWEVESLNIILEDK